MIPITNPAMPIKAVILDLDGTLIDSIPLHAQSFYNLCQRLGRPISMREIHPLMRTNTENIYRSLKIKKRLGIEMEKFLQLRRKEYYKLIKDKKIEFKEAHQALKKLNVFRLAIATNSSRMTLNQSTASKLLKQFDTAVTFSEVLRAKPNPEMLLLAAKRLHVKPSECMAVGDAESDIVAAKRAGMMPVAVHRKTGASTLQALRRQKPFAIIRSLHELPAVLRRAEASNRLQ